jgi:hypothetical protein
MLVVMGLAKLFAFPLMAGSVDAALGVVFLYDSILF